MKRIAKSSSAKWRKQREQDERTVELMGGDRFEILNFYASPGAIARGESAQLCYSVSNAKSVSIDSSGGTGMAVLRPLRGRLSPKDTTYTLTAEDASGHTQTASVTLRVR